MPDQKEAQLKAIRCELCSSTDVKKQGEFYVCQHCGTKHLPEAPKIIVVEGKGDAKASGAGSTGAAFDPTEALEKERRARERKEREEARRRRNAKQREQLDPEAAKAKAEAEREAEEAARLRAEQRKKREAWKKKHRFLITAGILALTAAVVVAIGSAYLSYNGFESQAERRVTLTFHSEIRNEWPTAAVHMKVEPMPETKSDGMVTITERFKGVATVTERGNTEEVTIVYLATYDKRSRTMTVTRWLNKS